MKTFLNRASGVLLPLFGIAYVVVVWQIASMTVATNWPSPAKTLKMSNPCILEPFS